MLTAICIGLTSTLTTFVVGPVATVGVALAGSALTLLKLGQLAGRFNAVGPTTS